MVKPTPPWLADRGTVYLAPGAFARPFERLGRSQVGEGVEQVRHLMAYLLDSTVLISDPGLSRTAVPSVRSSVAVLERIGKFWSHRSRVGRYRRFIVRR